MDAGKKFPWLPALLVAWNLFDIAVHVATNLIEPLRVAGNIVGIVAALVVLLANAKPYAPRILGGAAVAVVVFNMIEAILHGFFIPSLVFIGVAVIVLLLWAQAELRKAGTTDSITTQWWVSLVATLIGLGLVALTGMLLGAGVRSLPDTLLGGGQGPVTQLHSGELVAADYSQEETMSDAPTVYMSEQLGLTQRTS